MRFFRHALAALLLAAAAIAAPAQTNPTTSITATSVNGGSSPITGTVCVVAANVYGNPIAVAKYGGGFYVQNSPFCGTLTAGALTAPIVVPDSCTDSAPGHTYKMTIYDTVHKTSSDPMIIPAICGTSWTLDTYAPATTVSTTNAFTFTQGAVAPTGKCTSPALYVNTSTYGVSDCGSDHAWHLSSTGAAGESAYQIAVDNGFGGTQAQWLASLVGPTGSGVLTSGQAATVTAAATYLADVTTTTVIPPASGSTTTIGTVTGNTNSVTGGNLTIVLGTALPAGTLTSFRAGFLGTTPAGNTLPVCILNAASDGTLTLASTFNVTIKAGSGPQTFTAGTDFTAIPVGASGTQYIGYVAPQGIPLGYDTTTSGNLYYLSGPPPSTPTTYSFLNARVDFSATVTTSAGQSTTVTSYNNVAPFTGSGTGHTVGLVPDPGAFAGTTRFLREDGTFAATPGQPSAARTFLLEQNFSGSALPTGAYTSGGGTWTVANNMLTTPAGTVGYGVSYTAPDVFNAELRTYVIRFKVLATGSIVGFRSLRTADAGDNALSSMVVIDGAAGNLLIKNSPADNTTTDPGNASSTPLGFALVTGSTYTLQITVKQRQWTATVTDPLTGLSVSATSGSNAANPAGYYATEGAGQGCWLDLLQIVAVAGQFSVSYSVVSNVGAPRLLIFGDSITEGYELPLSQRYATLVTTLAGPTVVSGRSGGQTTSALLKAATELATLRPTYFVIALGTNDSSNMTTAQFEANITTLIADAAAAGARVIMHTLQPQANQAWVNTVNAWILANTSIYRVIRIDLAMSLNHDGVTPNPALYLSVGNLHPNAAGAIAMANRYAVDAPELLSAASF